MKCLSSSAVRIALTALMGGAAVMSLWGGSVPYVYAVNVSTWHSLAGCQFSSASCIQKSTTLGVEQDEPSILFYSNQPDSGNRVNYTLTLPKDPPLPQNPESSFSFQLYSSFWFGMAVCDTQSYPEQVSTCTPDSDSNIVEPTVSSQHPGAAFMKLQFYPPGWVQRPAGMSCAAKKWCAALVISSLSENPVTGQTNNPLCQSVAGLEYTNFAFITKKGVPRFGGPPNPVESNAFTFTPDPSIDLLMNPGDQISIDLHDTPNGLAAHLNDQTTNQSGSMTASSANGFGQVQFDPAGTSCNYIPYDFHPMYSTSSELTRVPWMAHSFNISIGSETGQFDACSDVSSSGTCANNNDTNCFQAAASLLVYIPGCLETNTNFTSVSYHSVWPNGNTRLHPTSVLFTSPLTGPSYAVNYSRFAFETNLPSLESENGQCNASNGIGCTLPPQAAVFYPFFSTRQTNGQCTWQLGDTIPGSSQDFYQDRQYGTLLKLPYTSLGGRTRMQYNDFRQVFSYNPCRRT